MKICFLFSNFHLVDVTAEPKMGLTLAEKVSKNGHQVYIVSNYITNKIEEKNKIHFFLFKGLGDLKTYLINTPKIIRYLAKLEPDAIHVHGGIIIVYAWFINLFLKTSLVFTFCQSLDTFGRLQKKLFFFCLSRLEMIFVTSLYLKKQLAANGLPESRIKIVRLGLENKFLTAKRLRTNTDIFFFGDSNRERGFDIVCAMAKRMRDYSFTILLRWEKDCLNELNEFNKLPNVFVYHLSYKKPLIDLIREAKIIFLPFRWMGVRPPLSIVESMACAKCVFTSTMEGNEEVIKNNVNGILSDFKDLDQVARQITYLINNRTVLQRMGERAKKTIKTMYSDDEYNKIIDYYALCKS